MVISLKEINKKYGDVQVLTNITIDNITQGSCVGLLGKNGAGKTTLFNILSDLVRPDTGHLILDGYDIQPHDEQWKRIFGVSSNEVPLIEDFTGKDFLNFTGLLYKLKPNEIEKRINTLVNFFFDDDTILKKKISEYSLGTRKKISLCAAVVHKPNLLILDEPFSNLDLESVQRVVEFLRLYMKSKSNIILIASHNLAYLGELLTRVVIMDNGTIIFDNSLSEFTSKGAHVLDEALFNFVMRTKKNVEELSWINE